MSQVRNILAKAGFFCMISIALIGFSSAYQYSDTFRIHVDEEVEAGDYRFRVEDAGFGESGLTLEVGEKEQYSEAILLQENINSFSEGEKKQYDVEGKQIYLTVNRIGWTGKGRYLNITVSSKENIFAIMDLDASIPENVVVSREEEISVPLSLKNKGTVNQSISLDYNASSGISVSFSYGNFNVTSVKVGSGETETVSSTLEILEEAGLGKNNVTFEAEGKSNVTETISFHVTGSVKERSMEMDLDQNFVQTRPGETVRLSPTIRNTGEVSLENVEVDIETPEGWNIENRRMVERGRSRGLRPHDRDRMYKRIKIPANAEPGDYYVKFTPKTKNLEGETKEVRVNIREKSGMTNVGLGLMIVSLLGMIATYRKLGRR